MKTIQMTLDEGLLTSIDAARQRRHVTRSAFLREAAENYLLRLRTEQKEAQHAQGYARQPVETGEFDVWEEEQVWPGP
jgi:metal-responsive CopG/Arc/MetJ family transcriptional regulator